LEDTNERAVKLYLSPNVRYDTPKSPNNTAVIFQCLFFRVIESDNRV